MSKDTHKTSEGEVKMSNKMWRFDAPKCWNTTNKSHLNYEGGGAIVFEGQSRHLPSDLVERERIVRMVSRRYPDFAIVTRCPKCDEGDA